MHTATFILPGVNPEDLIRSALERIRHLESEVRRLKLQSTRAEQSLCVYQSNKLISVPLADVLYIQAESNYSRIVLICGEEYYTSRTLKSWMIEMPESGFLRCHRSYLINRKEIVEIDRQKSEILLKGGIRIPASRRNKGKCIRTVLQHEINIESCDSRNHPWAVHKRSLVKI